MLATMAIEPPTATLVIGPEQFLAERVVAGVVSAARKADPDTERHDLDLAGDGALGQFLEAVSPTLFGGGIVLVATSIESAEPAVLDAVMRAVDEREVGVSLVLLHPGGVRGKAALERLRASGVAEVAADKLKGRAIDDFVSAEFRRHRRTTTAGAVAALRASVGDDLRSLASAASQLSSDVDGDPIGEAEVADYYDGVAGASGFAVSDSVWSADPGFGPAVVATVASALRSLLWLAGAPAGMSDSELAREVGVPPWKLSSVRAQLRRWTPRELADAARLLADVDVAMKGGQEGAGLDPVQKRAVLERTLLTIATRERPAE